MSNSILFVDDERQILRSINRMFIDSQYNIYLASSGREALQILEDNQIDMVVSDMKMPEMNGYTLLKEVKARYPKVIRIILSGYSDEDIIYKAIHSNIVKVYMFKPWRGDELRDSIEEIFRTQQLLNRKNLLTVINSMDSLPSLPDTFIRLNQAIENNLEIDKISEIIETDQAISIELLHIVNSAFYGVKTGSIKNAVINLGLSNIKNIVLASEIFNKSNIVQSDKELLWQHSSLTNKLMVKMYKSLLNKKLEESHYSAGLLHDIGKVVILRNYPQEYKKVIEETRVRKNVPDYLVEEEILGVTHNEIGAYLLNWWEIPQSIVEVALYHDKPSKSSEVNRELVAMVHLAMYYSWKSLNEDNYIELDKSIFEYIGFNEEECENFVMNVVSEVL